MISHQSDAGSKRTLGAWAAVLIPGLLLYLFPVPGLTPVQRHLLAIFVATIIALVAQPLAMGASVLIAITILALTRTLPPERVLSGFSNVTVWLIFSALLFGRAVSATGLGSRVAWLLIGRFGRSPLTLAYSVAAADTILAPFVPSDTARGGGIVYPIICSLANAFGSSPGATARRLGAYLVMVGYHTTYVGSAMFLTGMAANPLIADFVRKIAHVEITWIRWALGAAVPGILALLTVPYLLYRVYPPEIRNTEPARALAREELKRLGPLSRSDKILMTILLSVMAGWITSPWHGLPNSIVALAGVSLILALGVISWSDLTSQRTIWDALIWFGGLIMMADALNSAGVIEVLSKAVFGNLQGWPWPAAVVILVCAYLYIHYGFASMTAQITALYPGFLAAALASGAPPFVAALPLAYFSNLNAGLTHYGTGSAPVYFSGGYVDQKTWWKLGFLISLLNLVLWLGIGLAWWRLLGWWN